MKSTIPTGMKIRALYYELVKCTGCGDSQEADVLRSAESAAYSLGHPYGDLAWEIVEKLEAFYPNGFTFWAADRHSISAPLLKPNEGTPVNILMEPYSRCLASRSELFSKIVWGIFPEEKAEEYCLRERAEMGKQEYSRMLGDFCSDLCCCKGDALNIFLPGRSFFCFHGKSLFLFDLNGIIPKVKMVLPESIEAECNPEAGIIRINPHGVPSMRLRVYPQMSHDGPYTSITAELLSDKVPHVCLKNKL